MRPKRCRSCSRPFIPHPRSYRVLPNGEGRRSVQTACGRLVCAKKRRRDTQRRWRLDNPDYFSDRESYLKAWRKNHPGYWRQWRKRQARYVERNRMQQKKRDARRKDLAKQDSIESVHRRKLGRLFDLAKQDAIRPLSPRFSVEMVRYVAWSYRLAKQNPIALQRRIAHNRGHESVA